MLLTVHRLVGRGMVKMVGTPAAQYLQGSCETYWIHLGDNAASGEAVNGATDGAKKHQKKKSLSGVPEHKNKKLSKKKSMPNIHLSVKPGEYWYVRMKGHPP